MNVHPAVELARQGWSVFPCHETGKKAKAPRTPHGHKDATTDPDTIRSWWTTWPNALIGAPVPGHLLVIDIDPRHGGSMDALEIVTGPLPETLTTVSGRGDGGQHLYFFKPAGTLTSTALPAGVDLKVGGKGYCILPPSRHPSTGNPYLWKTAPIAHLPVKAIDALRTTPRTRTCAPVTRQPGGLVNTVRTAPIGQRNELLFWASCRTFESGNTQLLSDLLSAAIDAGLTETEATRTIASAERTTGGVK